MDQSYGPRSPGLAGYAPRSPDLAAYRPASPAGLDPYAPQSPDLSGLPQPQHAFSQQSSAPSALSLEQPQHHHQSLHPQTYPPQQSAYTLAHHSHQQPQQTALQPQLDPYHPQYSYGAQQPLYPQQYTSYPDMPVSTRNRGLRQPADVGSYNYEHSNPVNEEPEWAPQPAAPTPARRGRKPKSETNNGAPPPPPMRKMDTGGVEVKTKFPTARIKRIMQADEDVGKVAQVTPVVMAKALELFMIRLISASATVAKQRGSKRVLSQHMKTAVMQDDQFDNLRDIVGKVPDAPAKGANGDESDDEEGAPKKGTGRGRKAAAGGGGGRGKKRRDSDDF